MSVHLDVDRGREEYWEFRLVFLGEKCGVVYIKSYLGSTTKTII